MLIEMVLSKFIRRSFFFISGFALVSAILLIGQKSHAESCRSLVTSLFDAIEDHEIASKEQQKKKQEEDIKTAAVEKIPKHLRANIRLDSLNDKVALIMIQRLMPGLFNVDDVRTSAIAKKAIENLIFTADKPMYKASARRLELFLHAQTFQDRILAGEWGTPFEFWQNFGLGDAYIRQFANDRQFFASPLSPVQIYKNLLKNAMPSNLSGFLKARNKGLATQFDLTSGQTGELLLLSNEELKMVPNGYPLWSRDGRMTWKGAVGFSETQATRTAEADKNAELNDVPEWGIKLYEQIGIVPNWQYQEIPSHD